MGARISWLDIKLGARMLVKYPGLTLVGGLAISFGITLGAAYFEVVNDFIRPTLPLAEGSRVVGVQNWDQSAAAPQNQSLHDFGVWREELDAVRNLGAFRTVERNLNFENGGAAPSTGAEMSASGFQLARVPALMGRSLQPSDEAAGAPPVVVLGHRLWRSRFNGDRAVVGKTVQLGTTVATIVGVMPEKFAFPVNHQFWVPLRLNPLQYPRGEGPPIQVFGRLAPGATMESVQARLSVLGQRATAESPQTHEHIRPRVIPYTSLFSGPASSGSQLHWFQALFVTVLLVICANVATLVFARIATRENEIVVRQALGASRGRILMQLFMESMVLALVSAAVGLAVVHWGTRRAMSLFWNATGGQAPFWWNDTLSLGTVVYALALAVLVSVVTGVVPAIKATGQMIQSGLRGAATAAGTGLKFGRIWAVMIITQVAFSVAILPGAISGVLGWVRAEQADLGFKAGEFLSTRVEMDQEGVEGDSAVAAFDARYQAAYRELGRRVAAEPGVTGVTFANHFPGMDHPRRRIEVDGIAGPVGSVPGHEVQTASVDDSFFESLAVPVVAGRRFVGSERASVMVNQEFAQRVLGDRNATGRRIRYVGAAGAEPGPWYEIVGVVRDVGMDRSRDPMKEVVPAGLYHPLAADSADPSGSYPVRMAVHVQGDAGEIGPRIRALSTSLDPSLRLYDILPLDGPSDEANRQQRLINNFLASAIGLMALMALFVSAAGTYSLMSFTVSRRTREIGIRSALGANPRRIVTAIFSRGLMQVGLGIAVGALINGALVVMGSGTDPGGTWMQLSLLLGVAAVMTAVGLLACGLPAMRALRVQPSEALRQGS
jgi:predicted permease